MIGIVKRVTSDSMTCCWSILGADGRHYVPLVEPEDVVDGLQVYFEGEIVEDAALFQPQGTVIRIRKLVH
jgi:hypothetical protein